MENSLITKDNLHVGNLLNLNHVNKDHKINECMTSLLNNKKIVSIKLLNDIECQTIIINSNKYILNYNESNTSYDKTIRQSKQTVILDENLSKIIFERLKNLIISEYVGIVPYGLNVSGEWEILRINHCIRINSYDAPSIGFKPHYDSAFCENDNIKSALSVIIYLNGSTNKHDNLLPEDTESFRGGETIFYDKKNKINVSGLSVSEELAINGGLNTYDKIVIEPTLGNCIIFEHDILHCAAPITKGTKFMLRTDVIYRKIKINDNIATIFDDVRYQKCVNYFKEAETNELRKNLFRANELYERSISIRKSVICLHDDIWQYILTFSALKEKLLLCNINKKIYAMIICSRSIFWNDLYQTSEKYDKYSHTFDSDSMQTHVLPYFIPILVKKYGIRNIFKYNSNQYNYYKKNKEAFLRVITAFTIFLSATNETKNDIFVAWYEPYTKTSLRCNLTWLLICAYYEFPCYGSFYVVPGQIKFGDEEPYYHYDSVKYCDLDQYTASPDLEYDAGTIHPYTLGSKISMNQLDDPYDYISQDVEIDSNDYQTGADTNIKKKNIWKNNLYALNGNELEIFNRSVDIYTKNEHRIGFQVFNCKNEYKYNKQYICSCCNTGDPRYSSFKNIEHNVVKNNLIFNFSKQKIVIVKCKIHEHKHNDFFQCYDAQITNLELKPYFHAGCRAFSQYDFIKNESMSFHKNKYIDKIHIEVVENANKQIIITSTYSSIASF